MLGPGSLFPAHPAPNGTSQLHYATSIHQPGRGIIAQNGDGTTKRKVGTRSISKKFPTQILPASALSFFAISFFFTNGDFISIEDAVRDDDCKTWINAQNTVLAILVNTVTGGRVEDTNGATAFTAELGPGEIPTIKEIEEAGIDMKATAVWSKNGFILNGKQKGSLSNNGGPTGKSTKPAAVSICPPDLRPLMEIAFWHTYEESRKEIFRQHNPGKEDTHKNEILFGINTGITNTAIRAMTLNTLKKRIASFGPDDPEVNTKFTQKNVIRRMKERSIQKDGSCEKVTSETMVQSTAGEQSCCSIPSKY